MVLRSYSSQCLMKKLGAECQLDCPVLKLKDPAQHHASLSHVLVPLSIRTMSRTAVFAPSSKFEAMQREPLARETHGFQNRRYGTTPSWPQNAFIRSLGLVTVAIALYQLQLDRMWASPLSLSHLYPELGRKRNL